MHFSNKSEVELELNASIKLKTLVLNYGKMQL